MPTPRISATLAACLMAGAALLAACQVSTDPGSVSAGDLQNQLVDRLGDPKPKSVSCPRDLPAEVGQSVECTVKTNDRESMQTTVTVTKVDDGGKHVDFTTLASLTEAQLEVQVQEWTEQQKAPARQVDCAAGLTKDTPTTCSVVAPNGEKGTVDASMTISGAGDMSLDLKPA